MYPASKIFSLAMDGAVATRNQRSRAEVLTEMTALIDRLGLEQVYLDIHIHRYIYIYMYMYMYMYWCGVVWRVGIAGSADVPCI